MNAKIISLGLFALLSLVLVVSLASATDCLRLTQTSVPANVSHNTGSLTINFKAVNNLTGCSTAKTGINLTMSETSGKTGTWTVTPSAISSLAYGSDQAIVAVYTFGSNQAGSITAKATLSGDDAETEELVFTAVPILPAKTLTPSAITSPTRTANGTITLKNDGNTVLTLTPSSSGSFNVSLYKSGSVQNTISLSAGASDIFTVVPVNLPSSTGFGSKTSTLTLTDSANGISQPVTFTLSDSFCKIGPVGTNLSITDFKIDSSGKDDNDWKPLDKITVTVRVENVGPNKVRDITVELGLIDTTGKDVISKVDFSDSDEDKKDLGDLSDGNDDKATFEFTIPGDFDEGDYKLVAKAYSNKEKEENICTDSSSDFSNNNYEAVSINREDDEGKFIAFDNIALSPNEATCGDTVTLNFDAINVGDTDQDQVKILVKSINLGINTFSEIKDNLNTGDKKLMSFTFDIPAGLQDKTYTIDLSSEYDYRSSSDTYRQSSDSAKSVYLKVFGCSGTTPSSNKIAVSADLQSDAEAGKELVIKTTITNNKGSAGVFSVSASGYDSWASLDSISDRIVSLNAGQSKDITLKLTVDNDAKGEKSFLLEVKADSGETQQKEIVVDVAGKQGFSFSNISNSLGGNGLIWAIGIINVILIILIIVVAVKLSNR